MDSLVRVYDSCVICGSGFENVDGVGLCCSDKCWSEYDRRVEEMEKEEDNEE